MNAQSWQLVSQQPSWTNMSFMTFTAKDDSTIFGGVSSSSEKYVFSTNSGKTFSPDVNGLTMQQPRKIKIIGDTLLYAHSDGVSSGSFFIKGINGGAWVKRENGLVSTIVNDIEVIGTKIFAATNDGIYKSIDNGLNWIQAKGKIAGSSSSLSVRDLLYINDTLYAAGGSKLTYSADTGTTWSDKNGPGGTLYCMSYFNGILYAAQSSSVVKTSDKGSVWSVANTETKVVEMINVDHLFFYRKNCCNGTYPWFSVSSDTAKTFTNLTTGLPNANMYCLAMTTSPSYLYAVWSDAITPSNSGLYKLSYGDFGILTSALSKSNNSSRSLFVYPNPTEGTINIHFTGFEANRQIELMDISGRTIKNIITNDNDLTVSDLIHGTYFLKAFDGKEIIVRRVIVK